MGCSLYMGCFYIHMFQDYDLESPNSLRQMKSVPTPTPSPDSAIHSSIYSPSHSPIPSRQYSSYSSPYHSSYM